MATTTTSTGHTDPIRTFPLFSKFPTELQLKIWGIAADAEPRTIDLWSDWKKCEQDDTVFFIQFYTTELSSRSSPTRDALSTTCRGSRSEAQHAYAHEFFSEMSLSDTICAEMPATMHINFGIDTIAPMGHYNLVSFADFVSRVKGRLNSVAVDVHGSLWRDNLIYYLRENNWVLNGVREVLLYVSSGELIPKGEEYLDRFRARGLGRRELACVEIDQSAKELDVFDPEEEDEALSGNAAAQQDDEGLSGNAANTGRPSRVMSQRASLQSLKEVEYVMGTCFDLIEGITQLEGSREPSKEREYYSSMGVTPKEVFKRPEIKFVKMVMTKPASPSRV